MWAQLNSCNPLFVPKGRLRTRKRLSEEGFFRRSFGTHAVFIQPGVETPGYSRASLRDWIVYRTVNPELQLWAIFR